MAMIKISLVFFTVLITLLTAIILNYVAKKNNLLSIDAIFVLFFVLAINLIKLKTWGVINSRYNLSDSYPLVSIFFPLIYLVAIFNGEANMEIKKIVGIGFILFGIYIMNSKKKIR